ncbi:ArsR/SmtB family transcription factor [Serinicoccus chungangensis]|uniref:ArsR/SmtB family transcription factor n=1 Tax=Serinicoccus chungangensis TaxID=767452 RepID=UPI00111ABDCA|nr:metalloregulator ArsR/SmtB family transcription factor [Serinicoccus chungangensis]
MTAFDVLGDPVRRRLLEHLALGGEISAGGLVALAQEEFTVSQPAVSQHLRVLREGGLVSTRADGRRRLYALEPGPLAEAERWLAELRGFWSQRLDALETELARGRLRHRADGSTDEADTADDTTRRMA